MSFWVGGRVRVCASAHSRPLSCVCVRASERASVFVLTCVCPQSTVLQSEHVRAVGPQWYGCMWLRCLHGVRCMLRQVTSSQSTGSSAASTATGVLFDP